MFVVVFLLLVQSPQAPAPAENPADNVALQKTLSLMAKQPKKAEDIVKSAFRKVHFLSCFGEKN